MTIIVIFSVLLQSGGTRADDQTRRFLDAVEHYRRGNYEQAVDAFGRITASGIKNGQLFYNLGNAYLKQGRLGHALLWYERAMHLIPDDPDLNFNHQYALSLTRDRKEEGGATIWRILFFWQHLLSSRTIRWLAIACNFAFWSLLIYRILRKKKPLIKAASIVLMFCLVMLGGTAVYHYYQNTHVKEGIILPDKVSVRSGLSQQATELFVLHAGTKVKVEREKEDFYRIYFSEGKIGWLPRSALGII